MTGDYPEPMDSVARPAASEDADRGPSPPNDPPRARGRGPMGCEPVGADPQLLEAVLQETMTLLSDDDSYAWLMKWRQEHGDPPLSPETVTRLIADLLRKQFRQWEPDTATREAIVGWLWQDPVAHEKLQAIWRGAPQP